MALDRPDRGQSHFHLWHAATGNDIGGDAAGTLPLPLGPGAAAAVGKRNRCQSKLWTVLVNKCVQNEKVKNMLLALPDGDVAVPAGQGCSLYHLLVDRGRW